MARLGAGLLLATALVGCGAQHRVADSKTTSTTTDDGAAAATTVNPALLPGGSRPTTTQGAGGASPATSRPGSATTTLPTGMQGVPRAPLETHMAKSCVRRGDTQTITVKSTPGFQVSIATEWPDGAGHLDYNGWAVGVIPPGGVYTKAWTIPGAATYGPARTDVEVTNNNGSQIAFDHPQWKIATSC